MSRPIWLVPSLVTIMGAGCAEQPQPTASAAPSEAPSASAALRRLFSESDEARLHRNPLDALERGDLRFADQFGDYLSNDHVTAERAAAEADLARLAQIDRSALGPDEQLSYDAFRWQRSMDLRGLQPDLVRLSITRPIDHFNGRHIFFPDLSSGDSIAPFKTVEDYENGLKRMDGFAAYLDRSIARFREGLAIGVTQPQLVVRNVINQLDALIAQGVEDSPFYKPIRNFPAAVPPADQARFRDAYAEKLRTVVIPAYDRLRDFLRTDYLPHARAGVGLIHMPGGDRLYRHLVEVQTTTDITPEAVHQLGLEEVARIRAEMEAVMRQVGFKGTLKQFFGFIRTDPRFKPESKDALREGYLAIERRVETTLPRLFRTRPKTPLEIRPVPAYLERTQAAAYYVQGAPDGSRPGIFSYNTYDLPSRTTQGMETLFLHEAVPGHHYQISLAQENEALPAFQRFGGNTAYVEGWALYAESLGKELGLFTDPYQYYGRLDDEMLRAMRLVVDSGIHAKGWTRDQAIDYMLANSAMGRTDATAEVERYIAYPAQALSYKVGQLKIRALRTKAEQALGPRFDVREFHDQVLMTGALPMAVLETKIDRWIAGQGG